MLRLARLRPLVAAAAVLAVTSSVHAWPSRTRLPDEEHWSLPGVHARSGDYRAFSFDGHVHTSYSHDAHHPVRDVMSLAERVDLDAIVITDHGSTTATPFLDDYDGSVVPVVGQEVGGSFGHAVIWNVRDRRGVPEAVHAGMESLGTLVHARGGVVVLAHPGWWIGRNAFDPRRWMQYDALRRGGISEEIDALELWNQQFFRPTRELVDEWVSLLGRGLYLPVVGDSDFHILHQDRLGEPRNVFFCRAVAGEVEGSLVDCLLDAVRTGRLYVTDGPTLAWTVADRLPGEIVPVLPGTLVAVHVAVTAPEGGALELFVGTDRVETLALEPGVLTERSFAVRVPDADSFVRLEVVRPAPDPLLAPFSLFSNPVRLDVLPLRTDGWRGPEEGRVPGPSGFRRVDLERRRAREEARAARRGTSDPD